MIFDWGKAPAWANYLTHDATGVTWFEYRPHWDAARMYWVSQEGNRINAVHDLDFSTACSVRPPICGECPPEPQHIICTSCEGTGRINGFKCTRCKQLGFIYTRD